MAKRIFTVINRIALLSTQQGGYASKQEMAATLATASQQAFNALIPAKSPRAMGPGLNRELDTRLAPFLVRQTFTPVNGQFTLPATCAYVDFYEVPLSDTNPAAVEVQEVSGAAWNSRFNDVNCGPTVKFPIVGEVETGIKRIAPDTISRVIVQYYGRPTEPLYVETYPGGIPTYDDAASVDTGWREDMEPELIVRTLQLLGLEIRDPQLMQVAAQLKAESL